MLQVYQQAKNYDAQFKASESGYLAVLERKPQALAGLKPQVSVGAAATQGRQRTFYDASMLDKDDVGSATGVNYSLNLNKSLYNKALTEQVKQVDAAIAQATAGLEAEREGLILRVAEAYFAFLLAQDNLEFARTEKDAIGRQLEQTRAYFEAGRSAITDVKEAESRYDLAVAQELNAVNQLDLARERLRVLTGGFYQSLDAPAASLALAMPKPNDIEQWVQTAKDNNKQLIAAKHAVATAQAAIDLQRAAKQPVVDLVARQTGSITEGSAPLDPQNLGASVGVQVSMPLYTGGALDSHIREAQHSFQQAQQQYELQDRTVEQQVRNAFLNVKSSISQAKANQKALASAETAAEATQAGFEVGTRTAVDVLTSLRQVFAARRDYAKARYDYLLNLLKLRQAGGVLTEQDIAATSALMTVKPKPYSGKADKDAPTADDKAEVPAHLQGGSDSYTSYVAGKAVPDKLLPEQEGKLSGKASEQVGEAAGAAQDDKAATVDKAVAQDGKRRPRVKCCGG